LSKQRPLDNSTIFTNTTGEEMNSNRELAGVQAVFQTPFKEDGAVDYDTLENEIDWLFTEGADGVVFAMVSEILRLSSEERDQVAAVASRVSQSRGDCVVSVGAESTATAVRHARAAEEAGATGLMAAPPSLFRVSDDALFGYYSDIAAAVSLPLVVQDASGYVGAPLSIELQARLQDSLGDRVYFKPEAPPIGPRVSQLRERTGDRARIFEGTGGLYLIESFRRGAVGTMPAGDLIWALVPMWHALVEDDFERAYRIAGPLAQIVALQTSLDSYVAIEKRNLKRLGIFANTFMREPTGQVIDGPLISEVDHLVDLLRAAVENG
jgi:dihydrodipicolinate synthase/N-acetylneuraminate lyase